MQLRFGGIAWSVLLVSLFLRTTPAWAKPPEVAVLQGRVVSADSGAPLAGVRVAVSETVAGPEFREGLTNSKGEFEVRPLRVGVDLYFHVHAPGAVDFVEYVPPVKAGVNSTEFRVPRDGRVEGRVVDRSGAPASGLIVLLGTRDGVILERTSTANEGAFSFTGIRRTPNTHLFVEVRAGNRTTSFRQFDATRIDSTARLELEVGALGRMTGRVLDATGAPLKGVLVSIANSERHRHWIDAEADQVVGELHVLAPGTASTLTDADGQFTLFDVDPELLGHLTVDLAKDRRILRTLTAEELATGRVEIRAPVEVGTATVEGRVTVNGVPLRARIEWRSLAPTAQSGTVSTRDDGTYEISRIAAGVIEWTVAPPLENAIEPATANPGGHKKKGELLRILLEVVKVHPTWPPQTYRMEVEDNARVHRDCAITTQGEIRGKVIALMGRPVSGVRIAAISQIAAAEDEMPLAVLSRTEMEERAESVADSDADGSVVLRVKWLDAPYLLVVVDPRFEMNGFPMIAGAPTITIGLIPRQ